MWVTKTVPMVSNISTFGSLAHTGLTCNGQSVVFRSKCIHGNHSQPKSTTGWHVQFSLQLIWVQMLHAFTGRDRGRQQARRFCAARQETVIQFASSLVTLFGLLQIQRRTASSSMRGTKHFVAGWSHCRRRIEQLDHVQVPMLAFDTCGKTQQ